MFAIEMDLPALIHNLLKIIQAADIYSVALGVHPGSAVDMNSAVIAKVMTSCF